MKDPHFRNQQEDQLKKPPLTHEKRYLDIIYKKNLAELSMWECHER